MTAAQGAELSGGHSCTTCADCIHDGNRCCGCYDGACCRATEPLGLLVDNALCVAADERGAIYDRTDITDNDIARADAAFCTAVAAIVARREVAAVVAALTAAAEAIENGPQRLGHNVSVICRCLRCEVNEACARIVRAQIEAAQ